MTHFLGLVVGPDVDGQLAKYDEEIQVEPYRDYLAPPVQDESGKWSWPYTVVAEDGVDVHDQAAVAAALTARWGESDGEAYAVDEKGIYTMSTYNPRSEWDWYVAGGRWPGWLKTIDGRSVDEAVASEIDWDATLAEFGWPSVLVAEGVWRARDKHGWFGMATEIEPREKWDAFCDQLLRGGGDLMVTAVDFHI